MEQLIHFRSDDVEVDVAMDVIGSGSNLILLPALSSISTRHEMDGLAQALSRDFKVHTVDWPGFGDRSRPRADWNPDILSAFLSCLLTEVVPGPHAVIAAGHGAAYAASHADRHPLDIKALVLLAPTWRGPLPTMMGGQRPWFARLQAAIDHPFVGPLLYRINVSRWVVGKMAREHVYCSPSWLSADRMEEKLAVTRSTGARHASVRFVTGVLDLFHDRSAFLDSLRNLSHPVLMIYGGDTPRKSLAEMDAIAPLANVEAIRLPHGKLGLQEEFAKEIGDLVCDFLHRSECSA